MTSGSPRDENDFLSNLIVTADVDVFVACTSSHFE